jgi:hypothetical protein
VAISNHRVLSVDESSVTLRWKDYAHHIKPRMMTLTLEEFLRRFVQHVLPKGLPGIRYLGWLANRRRNQRVSSPALGIHGAVVPAAMLPLALVGARVFGRPMSCEQCGVTKAGRQSAA